MGNDTYLVTEQELVTLLLKTHGRFDSKQEQAVAILKNLKKYEAATPTAPAAEYPDYYI